MGDVPQMPGDDPFGLFSQMFGGEAANLDLSKLMRMIQSPGPVNMEIARETARGVARSDVETGQPQSEAPVDPAQLQAFDDVVRAVQLAVSEVTGISAALTVPSGVVDRSTWSQTTLGGLEPVLEALATALAKGMAAPPADAEGSAASPELFIGMMMRQIVPLLLGTWAGSMIGMLSHHALGQYDLPLPLNGPPKLQFVGSNVASFAAEWSLPADETRYAVALRECVHATQRAVPWVQERLVRLASDYVGAYEVQAATLEDQFGEFDPNDPASMDVMSRLADPDMLLGALRSEQQQPLLEELQRFVSVLEGYTDVVVELLGNRMVPSHTRIDEALRRHRLERGDATTFVDRLLGLELDRSHYDAGLAFCRGVMERTSGGIEELNRLWRSEAMLPTRSELEAPGLWLARIDLPEE